ncbi:putative nucleotide-diphospho-sugar transferase [Bradyrhizobium sp. McL0616]|uniref:putative nucleotide-diphospho-sugar transferase n=1 Tax=Bradyrhizobium sp. McL0616 TaxID=3415674 RepID=UPI003CEC18EA
MKSGKHNAMAQIGWTGRVLLCVTFLCAGFVPALVVDYSDSALLLLAMNYLWPTLYSLPVVRLKERGLLGVACDVLGSHVTPTLLALSIFNVLDNGAPAGHFGFAILAVLWAAALGLKGILHHQVLDRESDLRGGTSTFATGTGSYPIMRFLTGFNLCVELPISCALVAVIYRSCPLAAVALSIYCALETIRFVSGDTFALTSEAATTRRIVPFTNEMFYVLWFPMSAALQLAGTSAAWWWLPFFQVVMFYRPIIMQRSELAFIIQKVRANSVQPAALPRAIEAARPRQEVRDCEQENDARRSTDWTIFLFATSAMAEFVNNALAGIRQCGIDPDRVQVVFPASSERKLGPIVKAFAARTRILEQMVDVSPDDIPNDYVEWDTAEFNVLLTYRFPVLRILLSEGSNVVCADADVAWLRNPLPYLSDVLERYPWACQIEPYAQFPSHFCLGFFALKATAETIELIDLHIARNVGEALKQADQTLFRDILLETPRYFASVFALPESLFPTGRLYQALQFRGVPPPVPMLDTQGPFIFHANWCVGLDNKQRLLSHAGAWFGPTTEAIRDEHQEILDIHLNKPGLHTFSVPAHVGVLRLLSEKAFAPNDDRQLGAAITMIKIDGVKLPLDDPSLHAGFHMLERDRKRSWRWTDGAAIVQLPITTRGRKVEIDLFAVAAAGAQQRADRSPEPPPS